MAGRISRFASGDQLASAAGIAPALQQSGKARYLQRSTGGDRVLKRVLYQSAFCALQRDPVSRAYYDRKRREGKTHHQAVIALARRRVNVLHAILAPARPTRHAQPALRLDSLIRLRSARTISGAVSLRFSANSRDRAPVPVWVV